MQKQQHVKRYPEVIETSSAHWQKSVQKIFKCFGVRHEQLRSQQDRS
jgi:hypothetical protein